MPSRSRVPALEAAFGAALRGRREAQGLSQEEVGFRSGVHRTYISELERGLKSPSLGTVQKLAVALETAASALIRDAEARLKQFR